MRVARTLALLSAPHAACSGAAPRVSAPTNTPAPRIASAIAPTCPQRRPTPDTACGAIEHVCFYESDGGLSPRVGDPGDRDCHCGGVSNTGERMAGYWHCYYPMRSMIEGPLLPPCLDAGELGATA